MNTFQARKYGHYFMYINVNFKHEPAHMKKECQFVLLFLNFSMLATRYELPWEIFGIRFYKYNKKIANRFFSKLKPPYPLESEGNRKAHLKDKPKLNMLTRKSEKH